MDPKAMPFDGKRNVLGRLQDDRLALTARVRTSRRARVSLRWPRRSSRAKRRRFAADPKHLAPLAVLKTIWYPPERTWNGFLTLPSRSKRTEPGLWNPSK